MSKFATSRRWACEGTTSRPWCFESILEPKTDQEIANELKVTKGQVKEWIKRLVKEGVLEKLLSPTRYRSTRNSKLF